MNVERMKMLYDMLMRHDELFVKTKQCKFNIYTWTCGTSACALGSAAMYDPFTKQGLTIDCFGTPEYKGEEGFQAGALFFGLDTLFDWDHTLWQYSTSAWLFMPQMYSIKRNSKAVDVAARVKYLIHCHENNIEPKLNKTFGRTT